MDSDEQELDVLALEPWLGGSHRAFLETWARRSAHRVEILGLPARHWKWRMRSASWELARKLREGRRRPPDLLFASDYLDVPAFYGWMPAAWSRVPLLCYFHENQLTYPDREESVELADRDHTFGFINLLSAARADGVLFNSAWHREDLSRAAQGLLRLLPHPNPGEPFRRAMARATVAYPGIELDRIPLGPGPATDSPLRIAFNHRWEHDKDPAAFLRGVQRAARLGLAEQGFELVLLGEEFQQAPNGCAELLEALGPRVRHAGFLPARSDYVGWLGRCDLVVSTARHEFFGMAVLEAMAAGCAPLLPHRLSYPELLPEAWHGTCLYRGEEELAGRLLESAGGRESLRRPSSRTARREAAAPFGADRAAEVLDRACAACRASGAG